MKQADLFLLFEKKNHLVQSSEKKKKFFFRHFVFFFFKSSIASFLEYILYSIYVFKVVDFNFCLVSTGWSSFCCVNNGTCNCVSHFDGFAQLSKWLYFSILVKGKQYNFIRIE